MDHSLPNSTVKTPPTATARPTSLDEKVFSADSSEPPAARGAEPPMSRKTTTSATARTAHAAMTRSEKSMPAS